MLKLLVGVLVAITWVLALSASDTTPQKSSERAGARWHLVVDDQFRSGAVPRHWVKYDGPYGSGARNCASPANSFVKDGTLRMVMRYRSFGSCGAGWYSAGLKLAARFQSVDQKISVRFRVVSVDGIRAHRIIPMRWPSSGHAPAAGEEDYCEATSLRFCTTFLHHLGGQAFHDLRVNLARWHTMTFVRRNFTIRAIIDGGLRWTYRGTPSTLPATLKRPVLQQECPHRGCPAGTAGREVILIDWIKVWNLSTGS